jgi:hypothetical protein
VKLQDLLALFPDNVNGDISAADLRTAITDLYTPALLQRGVNLGPFTLPAAPAFVPLPAPGPVTASVTSDVTIPLEIILSAYVDTGSNNNDVRLALDFSGATVEAAGSQPQRVIRLGGKSLVAATVTISFIESLLVGTTTVQVMYQASLVGATVSNIALSAVSLT